ncbi:MAG TPA: hypothetical protein H9866_05460 [Candidatus Tidjanibacter gallistercoris]|nr:hypothetical protein [Candidatus Tidjanibacter gallistercoris]
MAGKHILFSAALVAALLLTGCRGRGGLLSYGAVAQVGEALLSENEVAQAIPSGMPPEDSLRMVDGYVDAWVRKQVKLQEAERVLAETGVDIDAMVEDYRNSLLTYRLDRYYMERMVDTVVSDSLVAEYYATHRPEFRLDRDIVKGRIVRLPASFRMRTKLKGLMGSPNPERQQDFLDLTVKNGLELTTFDSWVSFDDFLNRLPTVRGKSYDYLLGATRIEELSDGEYRYYVQITDRAVKGEQAPLEWVAQVVRNIIYNKRGSDAVREMEDSLYRAALENNTLKIYLKTNRE